jgi:hypothetical protein
MCTIDGIYILYKGGYLTRVIRGKLATIGAGKNHNFEICDVIFFADFS